MSAGTGFARRLEEFALGPRPPRSLPDPVRRAIAQHQCSSEVLVCLFQFGAIIFFAAFYALTPKAFPPDVSFEPVPWALAAYTLFTLLRFWLAIAERLTPFFLALSVIVDIAVLMLTIWSFHLQYDQPPTIYLKAPTLLYVFILIALRAMRFEAGYVLLAGGAAIVGWLVLVAYAVVETDEMRITRHFVDYMTSNSVLIGAEVDKVVTIAMVTAILAIAIVRARRLLIQAVTETHAAAELSRFFAPEVAGEIRSAAGLRPGDAMMREAAVMMVDIRGFTRFAAQVPPGAAMALLAEYQALLVPVIRRHGGLIDKYLGDGILATFGAARPSGTFAADALGALLAVLEVARQWREERRARGKAPLEIGVGVTCGPVLFGVTGEANRLEFTVIGDAVNLCARLEKHCKEIGRPALATAEALARATEQGFDRARLFEPLPAQEVAGVERPIDLVTPREPQAPS